MALCTLGSKLGEIMCEEFGLGVLSGLRLIMGLELGLNSGSR